MRDDLHLVIGNAGVPKSSFATTCTGFLLVRSVGGPTSISLVLLPCLWFSCFCSHYFLLDLQQKVATSFITSRKIEKHLPFEMCMSVAFTVYIMNLFFSKKYTNGPTILFHHRSTAPTTRSHHTLGRCWPNALSIAGARVAAQQVARQAGLSVSVSVDAGATEPDLALRAGEHADAAHADHGRGEVVSELPRVGRVALHQRVGGAPAEELLVGVQHPALREQAAEEGGVERVGRRQVHGRKVAVAA